MINDCQAGTPPTLSDGVGCTDDSCDEVNDTVVHAPNDGFCDDQAFCNGSETCDALNDCQAGTAPVIDDGVVCTLDSCDELADAVVHTPSDALCDDALFCNGAESCDGLNDCQAGVAIDCSDGFVCTVDSCDETGDLCVSDSVSCVCGDGEVFPPEQCDPPDALTCDVDCTLLAATTTTSSTTTQSSTTTTSITTTTVPCGNGSIDPGEECDPPDGITCDPTCQSILCGDGNLQPGEACDDGNVLPGDGCSADCQLEQKFCLPGRNVAVGGGANRVAFVSDVDWLGSNSDGNEEIFFFDKKVFDKAVKKRVRKGEIKQIVESQLLADNAADFFEQLTDTLAPVVNEAPTISRTGRMVAFVSSGDLLADGSNADGNREIFRMDRKKLAKQDPAALRQVTSSSGVDNLNPNLRASRGRILVFDSPANLVPDHCVGGRTDLDVCSSNADCVDTGGDNGVCGNPEQNRELFIWIERAALGSGLALRQITAAPSGDSSVGRSVNFNTRATAFSSTANFLGNNPDGNSEIYRILRKFETLVPITSVDVADGESSQPAQSRRRRIAFVSTASLDATADNSDGNNEVVLWRETAPPSFRQFNSTASCANGSPSIDARGRFVVYHSTCDLIPSLGNPNQSIFIWDDVKGGFLPLVIRGPGATASGAPQATRRARVIAFEGDVGGANPSVCFFDTKDELLEVLQ